jgi:hypothetical protein
MPDPTMSLKEEESRSRPRRHHTALAAAILMALAQPAAPQGAGSFDVDEDAAERALERALVQTGSLLLPPRAIEIVPSISFQRQERDVAGEIAVVNGGTIVGTDLALERNDFIAGVTVRAGLPWAGQVSLTVPYADSERTVERRIMTGTQSSETSSISGLGDVKFSYSHTLLSESGRMPSLLASVTFDTDSGAEDDTIALGSGFKELGVALTATKREDPLVFSYRLGYEYAFESEGIQPGDEISFAAGAFMAVSPATSLQFGFSLARSEEVTLNGNNLTGTDQFAASLNLGVATILRRNALFDLTLSVGLTEDSPDFGVAINVPVRLNL